MKKILIIALTIVVAFSSCSKSDFIDSYNKPNGIGVTTVDKQYAGFLGRNLEYVVPNYWNYFVVYRTTLSHYTQAVGFENAPNQYLPAMSGVDNRWTNYYDFLSQFREMERVYNGLTETEKTENRIFILTGSIYLYDHTQKMVDSHGDIPFSKAGMLSTNNGDYGKSLPAYDKAEDIYTKMLDDLKAFSDELNTISLTPTVAATFKVQDFINGGDIATWKKYCNSLRLRMLTRVSASPTFSSRATSEIQSILGNPTNYPTISLNTENAQIDVISSGTFNSAGFRSGLEDWDGNVAGKAMIDYMNTNDDPRKQVMFEPGENAGGIYNGLDPMLTSSAQRALISGGTIARYNRYALSRNQNFPGIILNAAEVSFLKAEAYLNAGNDAAAKAAYESGISQSVKYYYELANLSKDNTAPAPNLTVPTDSQIATYVAKPGVSWTAALTKDAKLKLIGTQKWIHLSVIQLHENWAEIRRLNYPVLSFEVDASNAQKQPPYRWYYPTSESIYNKPNYEAVKSKDNLTTKIFWDVN